MANDEMKQIWKVPEPTLRRLPWYLAFLKLMKGRGEAFVSSTQIAKEINVDPSQVAKDLSFVNISGKTRVGYEISTLVDVLEDFLGFTAQHKAFLFGVGSLGAALLQDSGLKQYGLDINHLYTHTHWLNVRDGRNGTIDQLNTMYNRYKMCPAYILPHWAEFKKKVQSYLNAGSASTTPIPATKQLYRVRKSWADAKSQLGAYSSLENAKKACKTGHSVFDANGNVVFSNGNRFAFGQST